MKTIACLVMRIHEVTCNTNEKAGIPDSWILLDSQSTVDVHEQETTEEYPRHRKHCHYIVMLV